MANDIFNNSGGTTGTQKLGKVTVNLAGVRATEDQDKASYDGRVITTNIADIKAKYDTRFDDPTYYD